MTKSIPEEVLNIYQKLENAGFEAYFVGGCVRDLLMGKKVVDWDLTTNATPEQIQEIFKDSFYDNQFVYGKTSQHVTPQHKFPQVLELGDEVVVALLRRENSPWNLKVEDQRVNLYFNHRYDYFFHFQSFKTTLF